MSCQPLAARATLRLGVGGCSTASNFPPFIPHISPFLQKVSADLLISGRLVDGRLVARWRSVRRAHPADGASRGNSTDAASRRQTRFRAGSGAEQSREEKQRVLKVCEIEESGDFVATRGDLRVDHPRLRENHADRQSRAQTVFRFRVPARRCRPRAARCRERSIRFRLCASASVASSPLPLRRASHFAGLGRCLRMARRARASALSLSSMPAWPATLTSRGRGRRGSRRGSPRRGRRSPWAHRAVEDADRVRGVGVDADGEVAALDEPERLEDRGQLGHVVRRLAEVAARPPCGARGRGGRRRCPTGPGCPTTRRRCRRGSRGPRARGCRRPVGDSRVGFGAAPARRAPGSRPRGRRLRLRLRRRLGRARRASVPRTRPPPRRASTGRPRRGLTE